MSSNRPGRERGSRMVRWSSGLLAFGGAAHLVGALTLEGAARHAPAWFRGALWKDDLADMSPANSAYWLSVDSFGLPLVLLSATVFWLDRRGIAPPRFLGWALLAWNLVDGFVLLYTPWPLGVLASVLLIVGERRSALRR